MEHDKHERQVAASLPARVYTYEDLIDPETFSLVFRRITELRNKPGQLTEAEVVEFNGMHPAWFKHMFDPI